MGNLLQELNDAILRLGTKTQYKLNVLKLFLKKKNFKDKDNDCF